MRNVLTLLIALLSLWSGTTAAAAEAEASTYTRVYDALAAHDERLAGGVAFGQALDAVEAALKAAGLDPQRQRFNTLVPHTRTCVLSVNGVAVPGVLPLGPNGIALTTTWGAPIDGPLVTVGTGDLAALDGKPIAGAIAVLDLSSRYLDNVFSQGARAVVVVDDARATQWSASGLFTELPIAIPRVFVARADAERAGLLHADGSQHARLEIATTWDDAVATNLWVKLPATGAADPSAADKREAIVLAANLDTFGIVPDRCPDLRRAANAALLAETLVRLSHQPRARAVYGLFLGSHYAAQDGARAFYFVVDRARKAATSAYSIASLEHDLYATELTAVERRLTLVQGGQLLSASGEDARLLVQRLRVLLIGQVNELNYELRELRLRDKLLSDAVSAKDHAEENRAQIGLVRARIEQLTLARKGWNELRRQVNAEHIDDHARFSELSGRLVRELEASRSEYATMRGHLQTFRTLELALANETVIAHLGFDFASVEQPWLVNPFGETAFFTGYQRVTPGQFAKQHQAFAALFAAAFPSRPAAFLYTPDVDSGLRGEALCTPGKRASATSAALALGIYGAQLLTLAAPLDGDELPLTQPCDLAALAPIMDGFLGQVLNAPRLPTATDLNPSDWFDDRFVPTRAGTGISGLKSEDTARGAEELVGPASHAIVTALMLPGDSATRDGSAQAGHTRVPIGRVDSAGYVFIPNIPRTPDPSPQVQVFGFDADGGIERVTETQKTNLFNARLFYAHGGGLLRPFTPDDYTFSSLTKILAARTDTTAKKTFTAAALDRTVYFQDQPGRFKYLGNGVNLMNGATHGKNESYGAGFALAPGTMLSLDATRIAAHDYARLNQERLEQLRTHNITNRALEDLQATANDHLALADAERAQGEVRSAAAHELMANTLGHRVHQPLKDSANDLMQAVIILLLLCIPFAFAAERLAIGATSIYRQIAGFIGIFVTTFGVLYATHPAFALASAPIVIFLAFVIIIMSGFVISVVMGKFRFELKAMQGLSSKAHGQQGERSTIAAAVLIGISGMRNRPLKTFLTSMTVVLLTFTILVFASFTANLGVITTYLGAARGDDRIELHQPSFLTLPYRLIDSVQTLYAPHFTVEVRRAAFKDPLNGEKDAAIVALNPATGLTIGMDGVLGFSAAEMERLGALTAALRAPTVPADPAAPNLLLSPLALSTLGAAIGERIALRGRTFTVAGSFDPQVLKTLENIDGTHLLPPNFIATMAANNQNVGSDPARLRDAFKAIDLSTFAYGSANLVALCDLDTAERAGAEVNFIALRPMPGADVPGSARELAQVFNGPVYASSGEGATRSFFTSSLSGSGFGEILVPLLLGGLIIFSSLLGSIVDRQKEIFTFSALGLSPPDVGALFFAESGVFAVIGGMGGYLISQLVAKLLTVLSGYGLIDAPEINFSSFSSIVTILLVMATVMLSTIYPALAASRSANPGVARKWKMPKADGDRLTFTFPFTVPARGFAGILGFIREHFANHGDASLGSFSAQAITLFANPDRSGDVERVGIQAEIALAPFDLGVLQGFRMFTRPSDINGIDEVVVELTRRNGPDGAWARANRIFIDDLRAQFLLWRSLPAETVEHYQQETERLLTAEAAHV